jgi:hypothetical protein
MKSEGEKSSSHITSFHIKSIHIENMDNCYLLIFYNIGEYFLLQRGYELDEQEDKFGFNTYYIEYCDQYQSCYGGIEKILLHKDKIDIDLSVNAANNLKINRKLSIRFNLEEQKYKELKIQLKNIFSMEI